ncbi:MAG: hypothetical protein KF812_09885 [Fimbriimonadaceae bacterium]|nr:hypothetical protein [Fimbriimonadaceae bacterium]
MADLKLSFFGPFSVSTNSGPVRISYSPAKWLLALLASRGGTALSRQELATLLWPEASHDAASNRLRVSLARLKESIGESVLIATKTDLALVEGSVASDLDRAKELDRAAHFASDQGEEISLNSQLLAMVDVEYLSGWDSEWVIADRDRWHHIRRDALSRISHASLRAESWESAAHYAGQILDEDEFDTAAWATYLRASAHLGSSDEAILHFAKVRRSMMEEGLGDFPENLKELARSVRDRPTVQPTSYPAMSSDLSDALVNAVREVLSTNPSAAIPLLLTEEMKKVAINFPEVVVELLDQTFDQTDGESESRYALAEQVLRANSNLYRAPRSASVARWILDTDCGKQLKCTAASLGSFAYFVERDFERAFAMIEEARKLAIEIGSRVREGAAVSQRGSFLWHQGQFEEALKIYEESMPYYEGSTEMVGILNRLATQANTGFVYYFTEDFESSRQLLESVLAETKVLNYAPLTMMAGFYYGYDLHRLGDTTTGIRRFHNSLTAAYRAGQNRNIQIGLDIAARFLSDFGQHGSALGLLAACERFRNEDRHTWSVAEMTVVTKIRDAAGRISPDVDLAKMSTPKDMVVATTALFEPIMRS